MHDKPDKPNGDRVVQEVRAFTRLHPLAALRPGAHQAALEQRVSELAAMGWSDDELRHFERGVRFVLVEAPLIVSWDLLRHATVPELLGWPPTTL
jgi:hypothetical protein